MTIEWNRWIQRLSIFVAGVIWFLWAYTVLSTRFKAIESFDWVMFQDTARLCIRSRIHEIYPGVTKNFPFFYPPFFVTLIVPLGELSRPWAYMTIVSSMIAAMLAVLLMLRRLLPVYGPSYATAVLVVLSSPSWSQMIVAGQLSALYLLILVSALFLWTRERRMLAGIALSLMMLKPNLGIVFPALLLLRRQWTLITGWILGFFLLTLSTLPVGAGIWLDYFNSGRLLAVAVGNQIPMWKQQTIYAFWRSALDAPQSPSILALWLISTLPLLILTAKVWLRTKLDADHLPRLFGLTVLAILSCNLYVFAYDTLLLALPGMVCYMQRRSYHSRECRLVRGVSLLFIHCWQYLSLWIVHGGWALVGPAMAAWLIADARDLLSSETASPGLTGGG